MEADDQTPSSNFVAQQTSYRAQAAKFFSDPEKYERLKDLAIHGDRLSSAVFFFVKEFEKGALVRTDEGIFKMNDEYRNAITNHKKRYYNFESKEGKGELRWQGLRNPRFLVNPELGSIALPLPRLVAFQWLIFYGFDKLFWRRKDEVVAAHSEFTTSVKRRYTEAHKSKLKTDRLRIERHIINNRTSEPKRKGKKQVYLTRVERQRVTQILVSEREGRRSQKKKNAASVQRRSPKHGSNDGKERDHSGPPIIASELDGKPILLN